MSLQQLAAAANMPDPDQPLDAIASALYEAERAAHPQRNMPPWERANRVLRSDARFRAQGAHHRISQTIKAVLVEEIARTIATLDGYIWPACEGNERLTHGPLEYRAIVAQRRQRFRRKAREVITAYENYMDVNATAEPEDLRQGVIARAKAQQLDDVKAVQEWQRGRGQTHSATVDHRRADGAVDGDGRF